MNFTDSAQEQEMSSYAVSPLYETVSAPQSVLSMNECAAYNVAEGTRL